MKISINVELSNDGEPGYSNNRMNFRQDASIQAGSFAQVAEIMSAFHELFERLKAKFGA